MNFKNKIILTFFVLLAFILFFNIDNVFAFTAEEFYNTTVFDELNDDALNSLHNIPYFNNDDYYYFVYINGLGNTLAQFIKKSDCTDFSTYVRFDSGRQNYFFEYSSSTDFGFFEYVLDSYNNFNLSLNTTRKKSTTYLTPTLSEGLNHFLFYSNIDVPIQGSDKLFFQQPVTEIPGIQIPALETAEQIPQAIATTLKILIPVGLIVLSIGFVVYLIKRVKSLTM